MEFLESSGSLVRTRDDGELCGFQSHRLTVGGLYNVALHRDQGRPQRFTLGTISVYQPDFFMTEASVIAPTMLSNFLPTTVVRTGLTYLVAYTWSKSIDVGCSGFFRYRKLLSSGPVQHQG